MDIAEARTAVGGEAGEPTFDAFLSYSHAADDLLAPRLQVGLQRFAKPWWRRRALHVFRDEASLAANPHLWGSITNALDDSAWFVLLLSPEAAASEWVNREVEYWLEGRDPERIIPVVTDGEFGWTDGDVAGDAVPPALHGVFSDEPRWVDLRFARSEEQLDLKNPRFSAALADIAAPIRRLPKEELESEEVRQHRRTIRTAWIGVSALLLLTSLTAAAALYANSQRQTAQHNEQAARESEEAATEFARVVLLNTARQSSPAAPAGGDFIRADTRHIPLPVAAAPPATPRLAFLHVSCNAAQQALSLPNDDPYCLPSPVLLHPTQPVSTVAWLAGEPFHIRHGFVNASDIPVGSAFPPDFEVRIYITRVDGPPLPDGAFELTKSYRFMPDYLVRVTSDRCGPGYRNQTEPLPCDEFVFEFPDGLPPGNYRFWVEWWAPCSWWTSGAVCDDEDTPLPLFTAEAGDHYRGFIGSFFADSYTPVDEFGEDAYGEPWPFDPWQHPQPGQ